MKHGTVWNETVPSAPKRLGRIESGKTERVLSKICGVTDKLENDIQLRRCMMTFWKGETTPITNEKAEEITPIMTNEKMVGDHDDNTQR